MKRKFLALLLSLVMLLSLAACAANEPEAQEQRQTHSITDHAGHQVELVYDVERVVVCDIHPLPSVLSVFFDSADKIVGMSGPSMSAAQNSLLSELYPEILQAKTDFISGTDVNIEELTLLAPDVVFYSEASSALGEKLRNAGFAAVAISVNKWNYNAIETLNNWILLLSEIFPENDRSQTVSAYSRKIYELVSSRVKDIPAAERRRAFFLFQYNESSILTSGKQFFGQFWAQAAGMLNVAEELKTDNSVAVSMEQILAWNPDIIFITNFTTAQPGDLYGGTVGNYDWSAVSAVEEQRVYKMPLGMYRSYTPGADTPLTLLWLAKTAYPALFEDIDLTEETILYYKEVFGVTLSAEQAEMIFAPPSAAAVGF